MSESCGTGVAAPANVVWPGWFDKITVGTAIRSTRDAVIAAIAARRPTLPLATNDDTARTFVTCSSTPIDLSAIYGGAARYATPTAMAQVLRQWRIAKKTCWKITAP